MRPARALAFALLLAPLPAAADWAACSPATHGVSVGRVIAESAQIYNPGHPLIAGTKYSVDVTWTNTRTIVRLTLGLVMREQFMQTAVAAGPGTVRKLLATARGDAPADAQLQAGFAAFCYTP